MSWIRLGVWIVAVALILGGKPWCFPQGGDLWLKSVRLTMTKAMN